MFFSRHPKPVVDPRPVAELTLQAQTVPCVAAALTERHAPRSPSDEPIRFTVSYSLREYLSVVLDFIPIALQEQGRSVARLPFVWRLLLPLVLSPIFLYKKLRVGDCHYRIDDQGVSRRSRGGSIESTWRELQVHALSQAYLVLKSHGGMPLPYRCFSAAERQRLERWASLGAARAPEGP